MRLQFDPGRDNILLNDQLHDNNVAGSLIDDDGMNVARVWADCGDAAQKAEYIVAAVNGRDALIDALRELLSWVEEAAEGKAINWGAIHRIDGKKARAAIAEVTSTEHTGASK